MPVHAPTPGEDKLMMAVRWKYCRASTAVKRVKIECERRGLIEGRSVA
jgi:hypothetical protein